MTRITQVETRDGSWTCYNPVYDEHYHNLAGALVEAQTVYVQPSGLAKHLQTHGHIRILDPFLGLGYNTLACLMEFMRLRAAQFHEATLTLVAIECDPEILAFIPDVLNQPDLNDLKQFSGVFAHNIHYQTQQDPASLVADLRTDPSTGVGFAVICDDARRVLTRLPGGFFHRVFHDPFSPRKQPELWTTQLFTQYGRLLNRDNGLVLTYSAAACVRRAFEEVGFSVAAITTRPGHKTGTLASLGHVEEATPLTPLEKALMYCKSGIPYQDDNNLTWTRETIINHREHRVLQSDLPGSSAIHQQYGHHVRSSMR